MRTICEYFLYFIIYSFIGWIYETVFDTIKTKVWSNRGFLFGPIVPIYGVGAISIIIINDCFQLSWWQLFLVSTIGDAVIEYLTSYVLEKKFHARWWDYHDIPLNINGRIAIPFSLLFGLGGLLAIYVTDPIFKQWFAYLPLFVIEVLALLSAWLLSMDFTMTTVLMSSFTRKVIQINNEINSKMEEIVGNIEENQVKERLEVFLKETPKAIESVFNRITTYRFKMIDKDKIMEVIKGIRDK